MINYLVINFFNNINKCKYYKCLAWFLALFIFYFYSIRDTSVYFNEMNLKDFRKWWRNEIQTEAVIPARVPFLVDGKYLIQMENT